jgi:hypothetical protein
LVEFGWWVTPSPPLVFFFLLSSHFYLGGRGEILREGERRRRICDCFFKDVGLGTNGEKKVIALILTITNTLAFSRCDKFSQASSLASSAMSSGGMARSLAGGVFGRLFRG